MAASSSYDNYDYLPLICNQSESLWNNAVVVADEPHLHALWHWLDRILYQHRLPA